MAGLYVYGLTSTTRPFRMRGIFNRPLRVIPVGPVSVIVETAARAAKPTIANVRKQSRVVAALVAGELDVLPARFGTFVVGRAELVRLVDAQRPALVRALKLTRGRVQMTVRVRLGEDASRRTSRKSSGAAYLQAQMARARRPGQDPLLRAIQRAAQPFARVTRVDWRDGDPPVASLHHLISRNRIDQYEESVGRVVYRRGAEAAISGPWAPFAFAEVA